MDPDSPGPPIVASIRNAAGGRHRLIETSDGRQIVATAEAVGQVGVREGQAAGPDFFAILEAADQRAIIHEAALRLLASRSRSEREMQTRLAMRGFDPETVDDEIERLRRAGLLDDEKFARAWVEERRQTSPRGRRMLRYELLGRGIDPVAVDEATRGVDDRQTAIDLARKRSRNARPDDYDAFLAHVGGFLRRRGFEYELAAEAARAAWEEMTGEDGRRLQ